MRQSDIKLKSKTAANSKSPTVTLLVVSLTFLFMTTPAIINFIGVGRLGWWPNETAEDNAKFKLAYAPFSRRRLSLYIHHLLTSVWHDYHPYLPLPHLSHHTPAVILLSLLYHPLTPPSELSFHSDLQHLYPVLSVLCLLVNSLLLFSGLRYMPPGATSKRFITLMKAERHVEHSSYSQLL